MALGFGDTMFPSQYFGTREVPLRTYEKTGIQIELGEQITDIRRALAELSRTKRNFTRRDLHTKWEEIDDLVLHLLTRAVTLAEPRGVAVQSMLRRAPKLVREEDGQVSYDAWYGYTLRWMALILRMLDEAQLLLTEESPMPDWTGPLYNEALESAWGDTEALEEGEEEGQRKPARSDRPSDFEERFVGGA